MGREKIGVGYHGQGKGEGKAIQKRGREGNGTKGKVKRVKTV